MSTSTIVYGLYQGQLLPHRLGGLCRGLEWWVEGPFLKTRTPLYRNILSAASFVEGQVHSVDNRLGVEVGAYTRAELLIHLLQHHKIVAIVEDGSVQSPKSAVGRETYSLSKMGMPKLNGFARWEQVCETVEDLQCAIDHGAKTFVIDPEERSEEDEWNPVFPLDVEDLDAPPVLSEDLRKAIQWLVGTSNSLQDTHRYVPQALWDVTEHCLGVIVFHADRDSDCIALYSKEQQDWSERMQEIPTIAGGQEFWIACSVPTMMLRWKRALYEACDNWEGDCPEALRTLVPVQEVDSVDETDLSEDHTEQESNEDTSQDSE